MNQKEAGELLDKYLQGKANRIEETVVQSWLINQTASKASGSEQPEYPLPPEIWEKVYSSIQKKSVRLWPRIAIAATIAIMIFGAGFFFYNNQPKHDTVANDIAPGKQGATLTLASGRKIRLSDVGNGELAKEAGVVITKSDSGELIYEVKGTETEPNKINTLTTAKGQTYQVRLPDGSLVWLNAASSLSYPSNFIGEKIRRVKLDGEGYFEIAKDKAHPFIVESRGQEIEVLGTHFNVNAYEDEKMTRTTLLEGSVKVSANGLDKMLRPDQQAQVTGAKLLVVSVIAESAVDWKEGDFTFKDETLPSIMRKLARWYNVEIVYKGAESNGETFSGSASRADNISSVLTTLSEMSNTKFKLEGRKVVVYK